MIPDNVRVIGERVFMGKRMIEKITLPNLLEIIEAEAFKGCTSLNDITLPAALNEIGAEAFQGLYVAEQNRFSRRACQD